MSKYKTVMQKNRRAAFALGITVAEYVTEHVWAEGESEAGEPVSHTCSASCTAGWPAGRKCHCRACGNDFSVVANFDKHLHRGEKSLDCLEPTTVGLTQNAHGVWVKQGEEDFSQRFNRAPAEA